MKFQKNTTIMTGKTVGKLLIGEPSHRTPRGVWWHSVCECGNTEYMAPTGDLLSGRITSCGCYRNSEEFAQTKVTHGQRRQNKGVTTRAYNAWCEMKKRCDTPTSSNYRWYGGKGITYCPEWAKFENFFAAMGECPDGLELDRFPNNEGNYEPGNCRWTTHRENCENRAGMHGAARERRQREAAEIEALLSDL